MFLEAQNIDITVAIHNYAIDGNQITVSNWRTDVYGDTDWVTVFDRRVIADSLHEAVCGALCESVGMDWEEAAWRVTNWGILEPDYEEVED